VKRRDVALLVAVFVAFTAFGMVLRARSGRVDVPADAARVVVDARVRPDGVATVTVAPGSGSPGQVREMGERIVRTLFQTEVRRTRLRDDGGKPYAVFTTKRLFEPGPDASFSFVAVEAESTAHYAMSWSSFELRLRAPATRGVTLAAERPPAERRGTASWVWRADDVAWAGTVRLHPEPAHGWLTLGLVAVGAVAAFLGISLWPRRRAWCRRLCGAVALVTSLAAPFAGAWPYDELGAAGVAGGVSLTALSFAALVWLCALPWGPWLLLTPRRRATMRA
jgi:hypothetical protein